MASLSLQRCFNHATREAVVRCPECTQYFCRECVTEHDDRMVCTACLKKLAKVSLIRRPAFLKSLRLLQCAAALVLTWFFFFLVGNSLLKIPTRFHEGTLWQVPWMNQK